ncbi:MAG: TIGR02266 family protein [Deltaproteobacteria bacterium]|nr:TIGR02266 family protein [Deltaproteobacteria bacterium]
MAFCCPACRREIPEDGRYCGFCGFDLTPMDPILLTTRKRSSTDDAIPLTSKKRGPAGAEDATGRRVLEREAEKRRERRYELKLDVTYFSEHNFFTGFAENISSGGIFVATYDPRPLGDVLDVLFTVPGLQEPSRARGRVVWLREHDPLNPDSVAGMGLRFEEIDGCTTEAVNRFIQHRDPIFYEE